MWLSSKFPKLSSLIPTKILVNFIFFSGTDSPKRSLVRSTSLNNPLKSSSDSLPIALASISLKIVSSLTFRLSSLAAFFTIFSKSWLGRMKNPFSSTVPDLKYFNASSSLISA